ncbi:MAG: DUF2190 family protein [Candidatus Hodarchaeales archaeon]
MANEKTLPIKAAVQEITLTANGTIRANRFVKVDTSDDFSVQECDAEEVACGVSLEAAADGDDTRVQISGVAIIEAGGSITSGDFVNSDDDGKAVTESTTNKPVSGIALQDADDGDDISVLLVNAYLSSS